MSDPRAPGRLLERRLSERKILDRRVREPTLLGMDPYNRFPLAAKKLNDVILPMVEGNVHPSRLRLRSRAER
jgi:hypothetical protein